jgi:hypothetical protein
MPRLELAQPALLGRAREAAEAEDSVREAVAARAVEAVPIAGQVATAVARTPNGRIPVSCGSSFRTSLSSRFKCASA